MTFFRNYVFKKSSLCQKLYTTFHCKEKQLIWGDKCYFSLSHHYYLGNYFLLPINLFLNLKYIAKERLSYQKDYSPRNKIQINISFSHLLEENLVTPYNEIFLIELLIQSYKSFSAGG